MVSINSLPTAYNGTCSSVLNDKNMNIVARNIVMLLVSAQLSPLEAAELNLHIWYSARLTKGMLAAIDKYAREPVADIVAKIKDRNDDVIQSKTWTFGTAEISLRFYKPQWTTLLQILEAKHDVKKTEKERRKIVLAPSRIDYRDRELYTLPSFARMCSTKFRERGVLAPFGSALDDFDCPNPLVLPLSAILRQDADTIAEHSSMSTTAPGSKKTRPAPSKVGPSPQSSPPRQASLASQNTTPTASSTSTSEPSSKNSVSACKARNLKSVSSSTTSTPPPCLRP